MNSEVYIIYLYTVDYDITIKHNILMVVCLNKLFDNLVQLNTCTSYPFETNDQKVNRWQKYKN